ncbi:MAG: EAL domain-containing protein [Kangiellaceae bacterium]|nr:EAL domain-containing protein [Kangiellaceae bacterium]
MNEHITSHTDNHNAKLVEQAEKYQLLFDGAVESILLLDDGQFIDCNPSALDIFGCTRDQIIHSNLAQFSSTFQTDGRDSKDKASELTAAALKGQVQVFEWTNIRLNGQQFESEISLNAIAIGNHSKVLMTIRNIDARKTTERKLAHSRKRLLRQNNSFKLINDLSNRLIGNHSFQAIADKTIEALLVVTETTHAAIYFVDSKSESLKLMATSGFDSETVKKTMQESIKEGITGVSLAKNEIQFSPDFSKDNRIDDEVKTALITNNLWSGVAIPLSYQGELFGCINLGYGSIKGYKAIEKETLDVIHNTVSQALANAHKMKDLDDMAHHDSLTGLANRLQFHSQFEQKKKNPKYLSAALLLLDLDRFKEINDTLGHHTGDILLQKIGPRLNQVFAGHKIMISRLGGDEFIVLIDNISDDRVINLYAHTLLTSLREPFEINSMMLEIDASIGIAKFPQDGNDSHALLRSADVAMYGAKQRGGGIRAYNVDDDKHTPERLALIAELNSAVRDNQLELHYQPKIDLSSGKACGFEALVRWRHPDKGLLFPDKFIPLAEMSNSIHQMTESVLNMALKQQSQWYKSGYPLPVAINLSARNLIDERCLYFIKTALAKYDIPPNMLELEITETALMQDPDKAAEILNKISALGVKLSLDDFGTGYSSLAYLRRLPINVLKIDREFVKEMLSRTQDSIIINSTITLAHNLRLQVVAEGVEDFPTLRRLRKMGCDFAQGYYTCKPKSWHEIEAWLKGKPEFFT